MSYSLDSIPMAQRPVTLTLGSSPIAIVGQDRCVIDFEETRFRKRALEFQDSLKPIAESLAKELRSGLFSAADLAKESEPRLRSDNYCAFDFFSMKSSTRSGFLRVQWIPLVVFVGGERLFCLHSVYDHRGARLHSLTMVRDGKDERTPCSTVQAASKVGLGYLRTYVLPRIS